MPLLTREGVCCDNVIKNVDHYPRLDTVLLVEDAIRESKESMTRTGLYRKLKNRVMYSTLMVILAYLADSKKIVIDSKGKIVWIHKPEAFDHFRKTGKWLVLK